MSILSSLLRPPQVIATLLRAGFIDPFRLDRGVRSLQVLARWGATGATPIIGAMRFPDRAAVIDERGALTFSELNARTNALANAWTARGIGSGDAIGILCRNHRGLVEAGSAAAKLGADGVFLNTMFAGPQLAEVCAREGVTVLVLDEEFRSIAAGIDVRRFLGWSDGLAPEETLEQLIAEGDRTEPAPPATHGRLVLLSSGTSGAPKGAGRVKAKGMTTAAAVLSKIPLRAHETTVIAPPLFHGLGTLQSSLAFALGSTVVLQRRFDPVATLAAIHTHRATTLVVVPVMLQRILDLGPDELDRHDTSSLRIIIAAGSNLSADLAVRAQDRFGDVLYNLYGSTEAAWATIATPADLRAAPGCAGKPPLGTTVRLYDDDDRRVDQPNVRGCIYVANGMGFDGYTGGETKAVIDGLMSTGDVGYFDSGGRLFIDGRDDEMIVSGGENVFPAEVEELLTAHDAIREAAVVGVPDALFGQRLKAYVVRSSATLTADGVREHVKAHLASYKTPRDVEFVTELPRNAAGKVVKRSLATIPAIDLTEERSEPR